MNRRNVVTLIFYMNDGIKYYLDWWRTKSHKSQQLINTISDEMLRYFNIFAAPPQTQMISAASNDFFWLNQNELQWTTTSSTILVTNLDSLQFAKKLWQCDLGFRWLTHNPYDI